jgi:hypothetical protein
MPVFLNRRERVLWCCTAVVLAGIYSTLGVAQSVAGMLRDRGFLEAASIGSVVLLVLIAAWRWNSSLPSWPEVGIWFGVTFTYLWVALRVMSPRERTQPRRGDFSAPGPYGDGGHARPGLARRGHSVGDARPLLRLA